MRFSTHFPGKTVARCKKQTGSERKNGPCAIKPVMKEGRKQEAMFAEASVKSGILTVNACNPKKSAHDGGEVSDRPDML